MTGHVSPRALALDLPDDWTDPATGGARHGGAFALLKEAERRSALLMTGALQHWMGVLPENDLAKLLGSLDYTTGTRNRSEPQARRHTKGGTPHDPYYDGKRQDD